MRISRKEGSRININIDGVKREQVKQFRYLRSMITEDCQSHSEIKRRKGRMPSTRQTISCGAN